MVAAAVLSSVMVVVLSSDQTVVVMIGADVVSVVTGASAPQPVKTTISKDNKISTTRFKRNTTYHAISYQKILPDATLSDKIYYC